MCVQGKLVNYALILTFNDAAGTDEDEEDDEALVAIDRKRTRKDSASALKRLETNIPGAKSKKRPRVLVEVRICYTSVGLHKNTEHFCNNIILFAFSIHI